MSKNVTAPMPGIIIEILAKPGDQVEAEDELMILEAMKMENPIMTPVAGTVKEVKVLVKEQVKTDQILAVIE